LIRHGNDDAAFIQFGLPDDIVFGYGAGKIVSEILHNLGRIGAGTAQKGRGLKRARTGADGKAPRVKHDSGKETFGFRPQQVGRLQQILQQLRNLLGSRGSVRLVKIERRVGDIGRGLR
jgi:hypothetical protein